MATRNSKKLTQLYNYYQIVFGKLSLNVEYAPPYERIFWDYSRDDRQKIILKYSLVKQRIRYSSKKVVTVTLIFGIISVLPTCPSDILIKDCLWRYGIFA